MNLAQKIASVTLKVLRGKIHICWNCSVTAPRSKNRAITIVLYVFWYLNWWSKYLFHCWFFLICWHDFLLVYSFLPWKFQWNFTRFSFTLIFPMWPLIFLSSFSNQTKTYLFPLLQFALQKYYFHEISLKFHYLVSSLFLHHIYLWEHRYHREKETKK